MLRRMQQACHQVVSSGSPVALCWLEFRVVMEGDYAACGCGAGLKRNGNSSLTRDGVRRGFWSLEKSLWERSDDNMMEERYCKGASSRRRLIVTPRYLQTEYDMLYSAP